MLKRGDGWNTVVVIQIKGIDEKEENLARVKNWIENKEMTDHAIAIFWGVGNTIFMQTV